MTDIEINEAVAKKLGWTQHPFDGRAGFWFWFKPNYNLPNNLPDYCHSIEAAWEIVDKIKDTYFSVSVSHDNERNLYQCEFSGFNSAPIYATADIAPMAICLAFLKLDDKC